MGTIMATAAVLEIHMERNMVHIMKPDQWQVMITEYVVTGQRLVVY